MNSNISIIWFSQSPREKNTFKYYLYVFFNLFIYNLWWGWVSTYLLHGLAKFKEIKVDLNITFQLPSIFSINLYTIHDLWWIWVSTYPSCIGLSFKYMSAFKYWAFAHYDAPIFFHCNVFYINIWRLQINFNTMKI